MITKLTSTTGTVKGKQECADFIKMANSKFSSVEFIKLTPIVDDYLQYTLLTGNRIRIFI